MRSPSGDQRGYMWKPLVGSKRATTSTLEASRGAVTSSILPSDEAEVGEAAVACAHVGSAHAAGHAPRLAAQRGDDKEGALSFARSGGREIHQRARIRGPARELVIGIIGGDRQWLSAARQVLNEDLPLPVHACREGHRPPVWRERGCLFQSDEIAQPPLLRGHRARDRAA